MISIEKAIDPSGILLTKTAMEAGISKHSLYSFIKENGTVKTSTNNHGGILGGITSGMPVIFRLAVKPTPSVMKEQYTLNLESGEQEKLVIGGRHDPCIVQRAVPVVQAAAALAVADFILK